MQTSVGIMLMLAIGLPACAQAKDTTTCPAGMVCASKPETLVDALQRAGYRAKLTKDSAGDPEIDTAFSGYDAQILFYGCEQHTACDSIQFNIGFKALPKYSFELANRWNQKQRFYKAYIADDRGLLFDHDVSTIGGLNQANFADVIGWADSTSGEVSKFLAAADPKN